MIFDDDNMHFGIHAFRLKAETYQRARTCARRKLFQRRETKILPETHHDRRHAFQSTACAHH